MSTSMIQGVQSSLAPAGCYPAPVDGVLGSARTTVAVERYQRARGLPTGGFP